MSTYHRLVRIKRRLPEWLLYRLDPYNTEADRFIERSAKRVPPGARVLDAGAGECRHQPFFAHASYFGTDNGAGDRLAYEYGQLSFVSDLSALPVGSDEVDAIISVNVLEHVAEPDRVLSECHRALRSRGRLYLVAPQSWRLHQAPQDFYRFTRYGLEHLLRRAGFTIESIEPLGGLFWNLGSRAVYLLTHFRGRAFPIALLLAPLLGFLIPLLCFYLDRLDGNREDTLGYAVTAVKP